MIKIFNLAIPVLFSLLLLTPIHAASSDFYTEKKIVYP